MSSNFKVCDFFVYCQINRLMFMKTQIRKLRKYLFVKYTQINSI